MSALVSARPSTEVTIDDKTYRITKLPALKGLEYFEKIQKGYLANADLPKDPALIQGMIIDSVDFENKRIDAKRFDQLFAGSILHLYKLYAEVVRYCFEDVFTQSDTEETA